MKSLLTLLVFIAAVSVHADRRPALEPLLGYIHDRNGLIFQVYSGGCTSEENFKVEMYESDGEMQVSVIRTTPDYCEALLPYGKIISFSYEQLGIERGQSFHILNKIYRSGRSHY